MDGIIRNEIDGITTQHDLESCELTNKIYCYGEFSGIELYYKQSFKSFKSFQGVFALLEYYPINLRHVISSMHMAKIPRYPNMVLFSLRVAEQLVTFLECLSRIEKSHLDLKPDNIMTKFLDIKEHYDTLSKSIKKGEEGCSSSYRKPLQCFNLKGEARKRIRTSLWESISRNIKENFLSVIDFGFVQNHGILFRGQGTPGYVAPPIRSFRGITYKQDLWSIGIIIYETLVGNFPRYEHSEISISPKSLIDQAIIKGIFKDKEESNNFIDILNNFFIEKTDAQFNFQKVRNDIANLQKKIILPDDMASEQSESLPGSDLFNFSSTGFTLAGGGNRKFWRGKKQTRSKKIKTKKHKKLRNIKITSKAI